MRHRASERRNRERSKAAESTLITECEAFLSGRLADHYVAHNQAVPGWAWLNVLAHGSEEQVSSLVDADHAWLPSERSWRQAVTYLAAEVRAVVETTSSSLDELQRAVLVPLEFGLTAENRNPLNPGQVVRTVLDELDRYRAGQRR
jgi:hypothetical protein